MTTTLTLPVAVTKDLLTKGVGALRGGAGERARQQEPLCLSIPTGHVAVDLR